MRRLLAICSAVGLLCGALGCHCSHECVHGRCDCDEGPLYGCCFDANGHSHVVAPPLAAPIVPGAPGAPTPPVAEPLKVKPKDGEPKGEDQ